MKTKVSWFFDFISPYSFLQFHQIKGLEIEYRPVLFAGLLKQWGNKGPAEIPSKREFTYRHILWRANQLKIDLKFPQCHPFNPLPFLRLCMALNCETQVIEKLFSLIWQSGDDINSPEFWEKTCHSIGCDVKDLSFNEEAIKNKLLENTNFAIEKGVFGVPTLLINDTLFWGLDATQFALEFQKDPSLLQREEYQKLSQIQIGARRK